MSLDWNTKKVADKTVMAEGPENWRVTEAIIFQMMAIGIREITEANLFDVAVRAKVHETVYGAMLLQRDETGHLEDRPLTVEDFRRRIGLSTNVTPETDAHYRNRIAKVLLERSADAVRRDQARVAERVSA